MTPKLGLASPAPQILTAPSDLFLATSTATDYSIRIRWNVFGKDTTDLRSKIQTEVRNSLLTPNTWYRWLTWTRLTLRVKFSSSWTAWCFPRVSMRLRLYVNLLKIFTTAKRFMWAAPKMAQWFCSEMSKNNSWLTQVLPWVSRKKVITCRQSTQYCRLRRFEVIHWCQTVAFWYLQFS